jgi:hypothetical protein
MRAVSAAFLAAVNGSHAMASRATVVAPGQNGVTPTGTRIGIESCTITFDSTRQVLATASLVTSQAWPAALTDLLSPFGNEVYLERGVVYGGGTTEWVGLGYYRINKPSQDRVPAGPVTLDLSDRMQGLIDARLPFIRSYAVGTVVSAVIKDLVLDCYPWATFSYDASLDTKTLNAIQTTTEDRYQFLNDLITSYGMIWYWDYKGVLVIKVPPNPTQSVATIKSGDGGVLISVSRNLARASVYSGYVASGQQATNNAPPTALVIDNNPASPTYWYGPFGKIPGFFVSSFLVDTDQCRGAAITMMQKQAGAPFEVDFDQVPNPALECWDAVTISYQDSADVHVISQMTLGLGASDAMTVQTRQLVGGNYVVITG